MTHLITIIDCETGESIEREMNAEELESYNSLIASVDEDIEAQAKLEADRISATAKLEALGLTADDLKALGL